ncbi:MAG: low molecular weight phosphatase family protein [Chitinivibrionales bacterium]|nr:low molecular weight phosphatase family protein [Chitinivibrionales bacterium]MBD3356498.1 low molecular weight phosphatase family protein [Chitinivibrionales bacterium]
MHSSNSGGPSRRPPACRKPNQGAAMKSILFLCTGNYYRSRFAEYVYNDIALQRGIAARAISRGLALERGESNHGPMCPVALKRLQDLGIKVDGRVRDPRQVIETDFAGADKVIALDEHEHRPLIRERFPHWESRVSYWNIPDRNPDEHSDPLADIVKNIEVLFRL